MAVSDSEGLPFTSRRKPKEKGQCFDKLSTSGKGETLHQ
jgi:hypothetical protein